LGAAVALVCLSSPLGAQAVPDDSPARRVDFGYRRTPLRGVDPFRHLTIHHWGFVVSGGATGGNNALSVKDVRALVFLEEQGALEVSDVVNALGLVPTGSGLQADIEAEAGASLGGPFGRHLSIGFTGMGRAYGGVDVDDAAVSLLRDGTANRQDFPIGTTQGYALATLEVGAHAILRFGPIGSGDGAILSLGGGARVVRPLFYGRGASQLDSRLLVSPDSVGARVGVDLAFTPDPTITFDRGSGVVGDFLLRLDWPNQGFALEAMLINVGTVTIQDVERSAWSFDVASSTLAEVVDSLDADPATPGFDLRERTIADTTALAVTLPRTLRLTATAWANRILQLDATASIPLGGDFHAPLAVDLVSTWRFVRVLPLRAGLVFGGRQGIGYTAGLGIEGRNFLFRASAASLGGFLQDARGAAGRVELGFFF
jgi:hypothetical protein